MRGHLWLSTSPAEVIDDTLIYARRQGLGLIYYIRAHRQIPFASFS
jgi:hypothetical protein